MSESEFSHSANARRDDGPSPSGQSLDKVSGRFDLIDAIGLHRLTSLQFRDLGLGVEPGRSQTNRFDRTSAVRECDHMLRVQPMTVCPIAPGPFHALSGINEYTVEVEQDCPAAKR